ncbi:hypothetical protein [Tunicatimonas pelagia]|uniref:hypothetical protein n=1 Tax=Tunicatimonas pelagia TaxID=931531 RepID=UPI002665656C|nr:hypothetical protein [Tunicatimonas pelagia]WKN43387.1 hypothetical protein P0M28_00185 [Tunicatimonas pelagia]
MRGEKRKSGSKVSYPEKRIDDTDLNYFNDKIGSLMETDFPLHHKFEEIKSYVGAKDIEKIKLCKLLYCTEYKKEVFLQLGIIIESMLNSIIEVYETENWKTPSSFNNPTAQERNFKDFKNKKSLNDKASYIDSHNIFNDQSTSENVKLKIQSMRNLRNYGGHAKNNNDFLESIMLDNVDDEIEQVFNLIRNIKTAKEILISSPPELISTTENP